MVFLRRPAAPPLSGASVAKRSRLLAAAAAVLFAAAIVIAVTGGFRRPFGPFVVSVQRPAILALAAWLLAVLSALDDGSPIRGVWRRAGRLARHPFAVPLAISSAVLSAAIVRGTFVAAGADPYGYVHQAALWAAGNPAELQSPLARGAPWPAAESSFCPLGFRPSFRSTVIVPTYAVGLPLQMAVLARALGPRGIWLVVPLLAALAVWMTHRIARLAGASAEIAAIAALLSACSPAFVFQMLVPMSDVPVAAWWLFSVAAAFGSPWWAAFGSGLCASLAVATRPNLLPLLLPAGALVMTSSRAARAAAVRLLAFCAGVAPGIVLTAASNLIFYGSPSTSGYGRVGDIYAWSHAVPNLARYPRWLAQTDTVFMFAGLTFLLRPGRIMRAVGITTRFTYPAIAFVLALFACYVFYVPFDRGSYLRFLLPGTPLLCILATAAIAESRNACRRSPARRRSPFLSWCFRSGRSRSASPTTHFRCGACSPIGTSRRRQESAPGRRPMRLSCVCFRAVRSGSTAGGKRSGTISFLQDGWTRASATCARTGARLTLRWRKPSWPTSSRASARAGQPRFERRPCPWIRLASCGCTDRFPRRERTTIETSVFAFDGRWSSCASS